MGGLPLEHAVADLAFRILNQQPALGAFHKHDEGDDRDRHQKNDENKPGRQRALAAEFERTGYRRRQLRDDA